MCECPLSEIDLYSVKWIHWVAPTLHWNVRAKNILPISIFYEEMTEWFPAKTLKSHEHLIMFYLGKTLHFFKLFPSVRKHEKAHTSAVKMYFSRCESFKCEKYEEKKSGGGKDFFTALYFVMISLLYINCNYCMCLNNSLYSPASRSLHLCVALCCKSLPKASGKKIQFVHPENSKEKQWSGKISCQCFKVSRDSPFVFY